MFLKKENNFCKEKIPSLTHFIEIKRPLG